VRRIDSERAEQRRLCALAQLESKDVGAVEHPNTEQLERAHVGKRQRHRPRVAPNIRARTGLIEVERRKRRLPIAESRVGDVERHKRDVTALEGRKQRLLPLRMLMEHDQIGFFH
jgi:hypothetical protein